MSYLIEYVLSRSSKARAIRRGARVDECTLLNRPAFDGGAHVYVFVEDTSGRRLRRRRVPSPQLKLKIADCVSEINLEFSVDSAELRENSLYKIESLIAALEQFRAGLSAEAELRALRERGSRDTSSRRPERRPAARAAAHEH